MKSLLLLVLISMVFCSGCSFLLSVEKLNVETADSRTIEFTGPYRSVMLTKNRI